MSKPIFSGTYLEIQARLRRAPRVEVGQLFYNIENNQTYIHVGGNTLELFLETSRLKVPENISPESTLVNLVQNSVFTPPVSLFVDLDSEGEVIAGEAIADPEDDGVLEIGGVSVNEKIQERVSQATWKEKYSLFKKRIYLYREYEEDEDLTLESTIPFIDSDAAQNRVNFVNGTVTIDPLSIKPLDNDDTIENLNETQKAKDLYTFLFNGGTFSLFKGDFGFGIENIEFSIEGQLISFQSGSFSLDSNGLFLALDGQSQEVLDSYRIIFSKKVWTLNPNEIESSNLVVSSIILYDRNPIHNLTGIKYGDIPSKFVPNQNKVDIILFKNVPEGYSFDDPDKVLGPCLYDYSTGFIRELELGALNDWSPTFEEPDLEGEDPEETYGIAVSLTSNGIPSYIYPIQWTWPPKPIRTIARDGEDGKDAISVDLEPQLSVINYNQFGLLPQPSGTITVTANQQNIVDAEFSFDGGSTFSSNNTATFSIPGEYFAEPQSITVFARSSANTSVVVTDTAVFTAVKPGEDGDEGTPAINTATIPLFFNSATVPTTPTFSGSYTFSTATLNLTLGTEWGIAPVQPQNNEVTYVSYIVVASLNDFFEFTNKEGTPPIPGTGVDGEDGDDGFNVAPIFLYQRTATNVKPDGPEDGEIEYDFETGSLTELESGAFNNWSIDIPDTAEKYLWIAKAVAKSREDTDIIDTWSVSRLVEDGDDGDPGLDGFNEARILLYRRQATQPNAPTIISGTYNFTTSSWDIGPTITNDFTLTIPAVDGNPLWVSVVSLASRNETLVVSDKLGTTPVELTRDGEDGEDGEDGDDGLNVATVYIYKRTETSTAPTDKPTGDSTYTFETGNLELPTTNNNWFAIPPETGGGYLWVRIATAASTTESDVITDEEWSVVRKLSEDGDSAVTLDLSNDNHTAPSDSDGSNVNLVASGGTARLFIGGVLQETGVDFKVNGNSSQTKNGLTFTIGVSTGVYDLSQATANSWTTDVETFTVQATSNSITYTKDYTISKGLAGADRRVKTIELTSPVITKQAPDAATSGVHSSVEIFGKSYSGEQDSVNFGFITIQPDGLAQGSRINVSGGGHTLAPGNNDGRTSYTIRLYETNVSTEVLDTKVINVLFKGDTGSKGDNGDKGDPGDPGPPAIVTRTSTSSVTIGTGDKDFTFPTVENLGWAVGTRLRASNTIDRWVEGPVSQITTSGSNTTVRINVNLTSGSGNYSTWTISLSGERGATGGAGIQGPGITYRGRFDASKVYFHSTIRRDVVSILDGSDNEIFYLANNTNKNNQSTWLAPPSADWITFDQNFDSVATDILLAKEATITRNLVIGTEGTNQGVIRSANVDDPSEITNRDERGFWFDNDGSIYASKGFVGPITLGSWEDFSETTVNFTLGIDTGNISITQNINNTVFTYSLLLDESTVKAALYSVFINLIGSSGEILDSRILRGGTNESYELLGDLKGENLASIQIFGIGAIQAGIESVPISFKYVDSVQTLFETQGTQIENTGTLTARTLASNSLVTKGIIAESHFQVNEINSNTTITKSSYGRLLVVNATSNITITIPSLTVGFEASSGFEFQIVKRTDVTVTLQGASGVAINGFSSQIIPKNKIITIKNTGINQWSGDFDWQLIKTGITQLSDTSDWTTLATGVPQNNNTTYAFEISNGTDVTTRSWQVPIISLRATSEFTTGFSIIQTTVSSFLSPNIEERVVYFQVRRNGSNIEYRNPRTKLLRFTGNLANIQGQDLSYDQIRVRNIWIVNE